jgi:sigma-E factor negative regulatory protein RseC
MILETGRIVAIEPQGVWVETIRKSACGSCKAEKGCGQSLINKWDGHTSYIWVLLDGRDPAEYQLGDEIQIGIPEEVVAKGAILAYMLPLVTLVIATALAHYQFGNDGITTLFGFAGLIFGGLMVRWYSQRTRLDNELQPVLVDDRKPLHIFEPAGQH